MKWFGSLMCAALFLCLWVTAVSAHTVTLTQSSPAANAVLDAAPDTVRAFFDEELLIDASTIEIFNSAGDRVDSGDGGVDLNDPDHASLIVAMPAIADGIYTVHWQVTVLDGDASAGSFNFTVGQPAPGEKPFEPERLAGDTAVQFNTLFLGGAAVFTFLLLAAFNWQKQQKLQNLRSQK